MAWFQKLRLRALAILVAVGLAVFAAVSFGAALIPAIGFATVAMAVAVHSLTARLAQPGGACYGCGGSIAELPEGPHGVICPACGAINDGPRGQDEGLMLAEGEGAGEDEA